MPTSRLLATMILLQLRGRMSATELAAKFEVSVRTIHRDIDRLSAAGVPVYAERGREGGFQLHDGYRTSLTGLSDDEARSLLLGGLGAIAADLGLASTLDAAQLKLAASLPPSLGTRAKAYSDRFLFDPGDWYRRREHPPHLRLVADAVWNETRLRVRYQSWKSMVERTIDPLGLVVKAGAWYLVAAVAGKPRIYRVSNVIDAATAEGDARRPRGFVLEDFWATHVKSFETSLLKETATIRLSPPGAKRLAERNAAAAAVLEDCRPDARSGQIEARIPIESIDQAAELFLALGSAVEVLSPPVLRQRLAEEGARLSALYGG
ncbi:MAG: WYL domain-containing protein [Tabrizicola sp.]|nr:WYL domain-containing protein [Tabrizicola sp.]